AEGAWFAVVERPDARSALADLVSLADRMQWEDPLFREELAAWLRPNHGAARDGMPGYALGPGEIASIAAPARVAPFGFGRAPHERPGASSRQVDGASVDSRAAARASTARGVIGPRRGQVARGSRHVRRRGAAYARTTTCKPALAQRDPVR